MRSGCTPAEPTDQAPIQPRPVDCGHKIMKVMSNNATARSVTSCETAALFQTVAFQSLRSSTGASSWPNFDCSNAITRSSATFGSMGSDTPAQQSRKEKQPSGNDSTHKLTPVSIILSAVGALVSNTHTNRRCGAG